MNYKSILLPTFDVQAIIDGRKTQTRRVIKPPPHDVRWCVDSVYGDHYYDAIKGSDTWLKAPCQPGDVLWVRETWNYVLDMGPVIGNRIAKYVYKADKRLVDDIPWRPSIHMPRDAARLFLRVTDVRAEWVQDISEKDAKAEGVIANDAVKVSSYTWWFHQLWDELNAKRGYGWDTNPWVWVYTFERIDKPEGWP